MKVAQKNVRVFHIEIDDEAAFLDYFHKNSLLLKEFFLLVEGQITPKIAFLLDQSGVTYKDITHCTIRFSGLKKELPSFETPLEKPNEEVRVHEETVVASTEHDGQKMRIFDRPIRSGEEIVEPLPTVIFGRVNSGAKVFCDESMSIYGIIDGLVQCDGEYIIINGISPRGHLIFNGQIVDRELIKEGALQKIVVKDHVLQIKEIG